MNIKVINGKAGIEITQDGDRIFIKGLWDNRTSRSTKGNWNISWHKKDMFEQAIKKYLDGDESVEGGQDQDIPF